MGIVSKKFQQVHPKPLFTSFFIFLPRFLLLLVDPSARIDSYELCLLCKCDRVVRHKCFYLVRSSIGCKMFQKSASWTVFKFHFFYSVYYRPRFFLLLGDPSVWVSSYELYLLCKGDRFFRDKCFYLERSSVGCKNFQRVYSRTIFHKFSFFLLSFSIDQIFTFAGRLFCLNRNCGTVLFLQERLTPSR